MSILNMVSNFSGVPLAFAYIIMFGNIGVMTMIGANYGIEFLAEFPLYSVWGLLLIYAYFQIPLSTLLLIPAFDSIRKRVERSGCPSGRQPDDILEESRHPGTDAEYTGNIFCIVCQRTGSLCVCLCTADEQCITASDPSVGTVSSAISYRDRSSEVRLQSS